LRLPSQIGITHCKAHQTDSSIFTKGNNRAHTEAKGATLQSAPQTIYPLTPASLPPLTKLSLPSSEVKTLLFYLHTLFHPNIHALYTFLHQSLSLSTEDLQYLKQITQSCSICQCTNPTPSQRVPPCHGLAGGFYPHAPSKENQIPPGTG
jgi:hypothetical protein